MFQIKNLCKDFAGRPIFSSVNWRVGKRDRIGLVGENGTGKSTLLKILAGQVEPSSGTVCMAKGRTIGYLPQEGVTVSGRTLFNEVMASLSELAEMEREMVAITLSLEAGPSDALLERLGELQDEFGVRGGYSRESMVGNVLSGLGFVPEDWQKECGAFSGGWQMRIALAKLLLRKPDILLLDEPTNHLDVEARNWLEDYLSEYPFSVILVSHDRFFMDRVCRRITEVWNMTLTDYPGIYSRYLVERDERVSRLREEKRRQDEEIAKMEDFVSRFRYKADKAALVQSRIKQLEKIERILIPPERKRIRFTFPEPPRSGRVVLELDEVTKSYGDLVVLDNVSLLIEKGERVCLVGHNGAGKSTLMRVLAGDSFQKGERRLGANVIHDYYAQDQPSSLGQGRTVYEEILADSPYDRVPALRDILACFLFSGDDIHKKVGVLSGGEKSRLALAKMLLRPANLLLLDEPTNHLDLFSKDVLLDALRAFPGTVVFVSHDRYFMNELATRVVEVKDGAIHSFAGNYEEYLQRYVTGTGVTGEEGRGPGNVMKTSEDAARDARKRERMLSREDEKKRLREEKARMKRLAELEARILESEEILANLERDMGDPDYFRDADRAREGAKEHAALTVLIANLYQEWEAVQPDVA